MRSSLASSLGLRGSLRRCAWALLAFCFALLATAQWSHAFTPDSPEVKKLVDKAVKYLDGADDSRLGGKCLIGMVYLKLGKKEDHPKIAAAVDACKKVCQGEAIAIKEDIYSTGIATVFLCEVDASKYRNEIVKLMESLEHRQRLEGGWGYPAGGAHDKTGDTSMTQYAVLATWTSYRNGLEVSQDSVERVCNWLLRTQDPSGGFGYQGNDPGIGKWERLPQTDVRNSLCAAGSGSLYICADMLRFKTLADPNKQRDDSIPPAFMLVDDAQVKHQAPVTNRVPTKIMSKGLTDANAWMTKNFRVDQASWNLYHLYALERYQSFRELAENLKEEEPRWYNEGVRHLAKTQSAQGTWDSNCGEAVDTAFGVLFLLRSTKQSIQKTLKKFGDGQLTGGRGLPANVAEVTVKQGKVVNAAAVSAQIEDLVSLLEEGEGSGYEYLTNNPEEFKLSEDEKTRRDQLARLRRLVKATSFDTRLVAVRALGRARDFDSAPTLIFALTDPDARIAREADAGLRSLARRFGPAPLPPRLTPEDKKTVSEQWSKWYTSLRPDADLKP